MTVMRDISLKDRHDIDPERVVNKVQEFQFDPVLSEYIRLPQILRIVECFTGRDITATHTMLINKVIPRKIPNFHLISWYGNFVERHSFCIVLGDSPETYGNCLPTKFPHQKIR